MILRNDNCLIGDFIGTIPAMIELSKTSALEVIIDDRAEGLFKLIPKQYGIKISKEETHDLAFDLQGAFNHADRNSLHMIQAHYSFVGLPTPTNIVRPELEFTRCKTIEFDYILAPFSRSLPDNQKWNRDNWQALVNSVPDKSFCLLGNSKFDDPEFIKGNNVTLVFDRELSFVCNTLKNSKEGLISVVTGISHLAYALNVRNYLFINQGSWGKNPEAIYFDKNIPDITVEEILMKLNNG